MNKILRLPTELSQQIAAGEVIERPFSVVKELVENSLDAEAMEIAVELVSGGKSLIKVTDNGWGMSRDDALICFERHSTSKISQQDDLGRIRTLGFRGEALPSISAVSRVRLKTKTAESETGVLIEREGEELVKVSDTAFPQGTCVEVRDLFFNLPARRKFLRSERSELSMIIKYLTNAALAFPEIKFTLVHGKRKNINYPAVNSLRERIFQIYGRSVLDNLMEVDYEENRSKVYGFASRPPSGILNRKHQIYFINKRPVRESSIQAAINQAYEGILEKNLFTEAFLFISVPLEDVDVNVHPAKSEVRFKDSSSVFLLVKRSIENAVLRGSGVKEIYPSRGQTTEGSGISEKEMSTYFKITEDRGSGIQKSFLPHEPKVEDSVNVLGQFKESYIIAVKDEGIYIIDQHNAHERILFDKYMDIDRKKNWPQKQPLFSVVFDLTPHQIFLLEHNQKLLEETGFKIETMGKQSFVLKEFPDIFEEKEAEEVLISILEELDGEKSEGKKNKLLATLACKTAVKAGQRLPQEKMEYLVTTLFKTSNYSLCPHGRPVLLKIDQNEVEKGLKRK
ncbi:MAG: DNA mismatch repair endonuclease MutL [Candidatus Aminicenantaceae bacterium]